MLREHHISFSPDNMGGGPNPVSPSSELNLKRQHFLELEGPSELALEQNLYDQAPFSHIISAVSETSGFPPVALRSVLTRLGTNYDMGSSETPTSRKAAFYENNWSQIRVDILGASKDKGLTDRFSSAALQLFLQLEQYPDWADYVRLHHSRQDYKRDGEVTERRKASSGFPPIETYVKWVSEKQRREYIISAGIEEIFPQDHGDIAEDVLQGRRRQARSWHILKASELVRVKKR